MNYFSSGCEDYLELKADLGFFDPEANEIDI